MKISMIVPTYISRDTKTGWQEGDAVYDHPTPLDQKGTLRRFFDSLHVLENLNFDLVIILSTTSPDINAAAREKVLNDVKNSKVPVPVYIFGDEEVQQTKKMILDSEVTEGKPDKIGMDLLNIRGYPNVRNMCLFTSYITGSDVAVLIDDDEVFEDSKFMDKAAEYIGRRFHGKTIDGVAGYYLNSDGNYYDKITRVPWMTYWDRFGDKTEAFDLIIGRKPRLKETPFAFGGLMVIHRNLLKVVPFDPKITRGEDIDYLLNAKMFGFNFFLDNTLSIKHLPPKKSHPVWKRIREDITRFQYEKAKIDTQVDVPNLTRVSAKTFYPYPGKFLDDSLEEKVIHSNVMLAMDCLADNDTEGARECMRNIFLYKENKVDWDVFAYLLELQGHWRELLVYCNRNLRLAIGRMIDESKICFTEKNEDAKGFMSLSMEKKITYLERIDLFAGLPRKVLTVIANIAQYKTLPRDEVIFKEGQETDGQYIIIHGAVSLLRGENGGEHELKVFKDWESIGEMSLITRDIHSVSAITKEETQVMLIRRSDFEKELIHNPNFANIIYKNIALVTAKRLKSATNKLIQVKDQKVLASDIFD